MKIYERLSDGSIQIREMVIDPEKARKYKIDEMSNIPYEKRVFNASCIYEGEELAPNKTSFYSYLYVKFLKDMSIDEQITALKALNGYYSSTRKNSEIAKIEGNYSKFPLNPQYVLLGDKEYSSKWKMNNNIVLPTTLMKLQRFENGNLDYANSQIISLFNILDPLDNSIISKEMFVNLVNLLNEGQPIDPKNPGYGISQEDLIRLINLGFVVDDLYNKVEQTDNILKLKK